jgi:hypothetical protein
MPFNEQDHYELVEGENPSVVRARSHRKSARDTPDERSDSKYHVQPVHFPRYFPEQALDGKLDKCTTANTN